MSSLVQPASNHRGRTARTVVLASSFGTALALASVCCGKFGTLEDAEGSEDATSAVSDAGQTEPPTPDPRGDATSPEADAAFDADTETGCRITDLPVRCSASDMDSGGRCFGRFGGDSGASFVADLPDAGGVVLTPAQGGRTGSYWVRWRMPAAGGYWRLDLTVPALPEGGLPADGFGIAMLRRRPGMNVGAIPVGLERGGSALGLMPVDGFEGNAAIVATYLGITGTGKISLASRPLPSNDTSSGPVLEVFAANTGARLRVEIEPTGSEELTDAGARVRATQIRLYRIGAASEPLATMPMWIPADAELLGISSATGGFFSEHRIERIALCEPRSTNADYQNR